MRVCTAKQEAKRACAPRQYASRCVRACCKMSFCAQRVRSGVFTREVTTCSYGHREICHALLQKQLMRVRAVRAPRARGIRARAQRVVPQRMYVLGSPQTASHAISEIAKRMRRPIAQRVKRMRRDTLRSGDATWRVRTTQRCAAAIFLRAACTPYGAQRDFPHHVRVVRICVQIRCGAYARRSLSRASSARSPHVERRARCRHADYEAIIYLMLSDARRRLCL